MWNTFVLSNDLINANTGVFDPRHMMGVTNQDVFRWPAITNGLQRQVLGHFITTILMPGIPKLLWGEEQAYYVLDSTNANYLFRKTAHVLRHRMAITRLLFPGFHPVLQHALELYTERLQR